MTDYQLRTTDIVVYPVEKFPLHHNATRVQLAGDPDGGYFIRLEQEDQAIELDPEELPLVLEAARRLLKGDIPAEAANTQRNWDAWPQALSTANSLPVKNQFILNDHDHH